MGPGFPFRRSSFYALLSDSGHYYDCHVCLWTHLTTTLPHYVLDSYVTAFSDFHEKVTMHICDIDTSSHIFAF